MPPFYPIFACVDPPGSRKLLNIDPIRIRIHNTDFKVYTIHCAVQYTDVYVHLGKQILKKEFFFCPRSILHNGGPVSPLLGFYIILTSCTVGWVNLYHKFEIEKYTVCGKLILPQKMKRHFKNNWHNWLANLHGFANICKPPVSNTFKDMQSKILNLIESSFT